MARNFQDHRPRRNCFSLGVEFAVFPADKVQQRLGTKAMSSKKTILVVHDDPSVITLIQPVLESLGFEVAATSSNDVLSTFEKVQPSFVVLAPCVPISKRQEIPTQLKSRAPHVTVFQLDSMSPKELQAQIAIGAGSIQ
jgi:CheY-like chemotaxis protein